MDIIKYCPQPRKNKYFISFERSEIALLTCDGLYSYAVIKNSIVILILFALNFLAVLLFKLKMAALFPSIFLVLPSMNILLTVNSAVLSLGFSYALHSLTVLCSSSKTATSCLMLFMGKLWFHVYFLNFIPYLSKCLRYIEQELPL